MLWSKGLLADVELVLALWPFICCSPKVFWQTWSRFFGHGSFLAFDVLQSKGLLADVELFFGHGSLLAFDVWFLGHGSLLAFDVLLSKGLLADEEPFF